MPKFIVDLWLDGYETEEEANAAAKEFIDDQLNFSGSSVQIQEVTPCANCERLEEEHSHVVKRLVESRDYALKLGQEMERLQKQLEMFTEDNIREVILDWKHAWMNQTQNSKEDYYNYFKRAFGIDANMQCDLARKIAALAKLEKE